MHAYRSGLQRVVMRSSRCDLKRVVYLHEKESFLARFEFTGDHENDFLEIANITFAANIVH